MPQSTEAIRRNMLFLCQTLPFPPSGGVSIRTYNLLRQLAAGFRIDLICFSRRSTTRGLQQSVKALGDIARVQAFPIPQEHSRVRLLSDHALSVLTGRVYTVPSYRSLEFERAVTQSLLATQYDVVHVDSLDLSRYLRHFDLRRVACTHHNVESELLARRSRLPGSTKLRAAYFGFQSRLMRREESSWIDRVALNVAVSDADRTALTAISPAARVVTIPNGVDTEFFQPARDSSGGIVFVGGMTWFPNRDAFHFFMSDILPRLRAEGVHDKVTWVGRSGAGIDSPSPSAGVELTGFVDDIRPIVSKAACYIVPLRVGGGTRLKILDAWAMGMAVVSTSVGCEGLDAIDGYNILVRDDPQDFSRAVAEVLTNRDLRLHLKRNARTTAVDKYAWPRIGSQLLAAYDDLIGRAGE